MLSFSASLPTDLAAAVAEQQSKWVAAGVVWPTIVDDQLADVSRFKALSAEISEDGFAHLVILGIAPEVLGAAFGKQANAPQLEVLDSTDPAQIRALRAKIDPARTLFCVSSKSGRTLEANLLLQYFYEEISKAVGSERAGHHFLAVTDLGSPLESVAQELGFRRVYYGVPNIAGHYSAFSDFGLIPFAGAGLDTERFLKRTQLMAEACRNEDAAVNLGVSLGLILRAAATQCGRDKVTVICSPSLQALGPWLEQLLASIGLIPVDREPVLTAEQYDNDRVFVHIQYAADSDPNEAAIKGLEKAGQPVLCFALKDLYDLGQLLFQWELAAMVIGPKALGPADEHLADAFGAQPILVHDGISLLADKANAGMLLGNGGTPTLGGLIRNHLDRLRARDYFGLLAYLPAFPQHEAALQQIRRKILEAKRAATVLGFGPRFEHSSGQLYGHGPNTGVFLQITCEDSEDLAAPGESKTFGEMKAAQAGAHFQILADHQRRVLQIHLGRDVSAGLARLHDLVSAAVAH